jgi:hypothetical protein
MNYIRKMRLVEDKNVGRRLRRMMEGVNSTMIDCKNLSECHYVPPVLQ